MTAADIIAQAPELPPISEAALKLLTLLGNPDHDGADIVKAIQVDAMLTARLLRACNSAYQGRRQPIASIDQAVLQLGQQETLRLVLALNVGDALARPLDGYAVGERELWQHALTTALAAAQLVHHGLPAPYEAHVAYTAGLLHDLGKVVLNRALDPALQTALRSYIQDHHASRPEAERALLGTDHAEVGATLLAQWRLPPEVVEAVAHHHQPPSQSPLPLSAIIHLANSLAHATGSSPGWEGYAVRIDESVAPRLGLGPADIEHLMIQIHLSLAQVRQFLSLP